MAKNSQELVEANKNLARSNYDMQEAMQESARFAQELKDKFSGALTDIVFDFDNAGDAAKRFFETIARAAIEKKIAGPLVDSLLGASSGGVGLLDNLFGGFFADGGRPPMGKVSVVGENGPELFVPDTAGTIVPNGVGGGGGISVSNNWYIQSGVSKQEVLALIPIIEAKSTASVFRAIERGGSAAQAVGRRSGG